METRSLGDYVFVGIHRRYTGRHHRVTAPAKKLGVKYVVSASVFPVLLAASCSSNTKPPTPFRFKEQQYVTTSVLNLLLLHAPLPRVLAMCLVVDTWLVVRERE